MNWIHLWRIHRAWFGISFRIQGFPFTSSNFPLTLHLLHLPHSRLPCTHLPQRTLAYFLQLGTLSYLLSSISLVSSIRLSPLWPRKRAQIASILKIKLKGNKTTKKTSSALLSSQVHPISQLLSPTSGSQMMLCGLAAVELSVPVSQVQPLQIWLTGSDVGPRNFIFQVPSKWWGCSAKFLNHWFILTVFISSPPTPNTHQADLITTGLSSHC